MATLLVTVGMGPWPFNRLVTAVAPLCAYHDVFVQTGASSVVPPCPHERYVPYDEMQRRLAEADIVITHAASTVRLVQRLGGVPIVVARQRRLGETDSTQQEDYLRLEERTGRVHAVWDVQRLPSAVAGHTGVAASMLATRPLASVAPADDLIAILDEIAARLCRRPSA
ncbi:glycosyltransferase [Paractinoplanes globisporus]|uniref:Glycosyltransferase n=1 Tax=Paractinoplanes globisporus TaxID=113565 RepID=A0ABW6WAV5_9ACTN|nr:glycosyltransferase [Actinoplanes globisporus]